jgi:hypothetical protein
LLYVEKPWIKHESFTNFKSKEKRRKQVLEFSKDVVLVNRNICI